VVVRNDVMCHLCSRWKQTDFSDFEWLGFNEVFDHFLRNLCIRVDRQSPGTCFLIKQALDRVLNESGRNLNFNVLAMGVNSCGPGVR
jgi:hypothetical protein